MRTLRPTRYLALVAALLVTTAGGYFAYQRFGPRPAVAAPIATTLVSRGSITSNVSATGSVASPAQTRLTFKSGGRVTELLVKVGDQVEAGQPLARIDPSDLQAALRQAQSAYDSAVAKLDLSTAGSRPEDIAAAQAQVDSARIALTQKQAVPGSADVAAAQSQLETARIKLAQAQTPLPADVVAAQAQVDAANAKLAAVQTPRAEDVATAQSQLASTQSKLDALQHPRPEDVRTAELAVVTARAKLDALQHPRPQDIAAAQSAVDQARTKLSQLQDQPQTATPQDVANAELAVNNAQVAYDKALADVGANSSASVGSAAAPNGTSAAAASRATQANNDATIKQALIALQTAQNTLQKLREQGPTAWDVRTAQQAVEQAQVNLDKAKTPAPADIQQAQAAVEQAQATLDKTRTPSPYDVQQAQEAVTQAQAGVDKVTTPAPADVAGAQQGAVAAQTALDKLVSPSGYDVRAAQEAVTQAQAGVDKLLTANGYDVRTAQASLASAQANLDKVRNGNTAQDIAQAQATVDQAAAQLRQAQANLDAATLVAPIPGVVTATGANPGENTTSGTASTTSTSATATTDAGAVTLVDTRQVRVDLVVGESDIARVQVGQDVALTFDALTGKSLTGKVDVIAPTATTSNGVVTYQVRVAVDPAQAQAIGVRSGMSATGAIVTAKKDDAVVVPSRVLKTVGGAKTAQVLDPAGQPQTRPVQTGIVGDQQTEIVGGLQPGDRVVTTVTGAAAARATSGQAGLGGLPGAALGGPPGGGGRP